MEQGLGKILHYGSKELSVDFRGLSFKQLRWATFSDPELINLIKYLASCQLQYYLYILPFESRIY
jgi:hypothetical protein